MVLPDVNVLVYAHREDTADHRRYRGWLESVVNSSGAYGLSDLALSGFLRLLIAVVWTVVRTILVGWTLKSGTAPV